MSISTAARAMRIVAIPLTRPAGDATLKTAAPRTMLTYYHFQISKPPKPSRQKKADVQGAVQACVEKLGSLDAVRVTSRLHDSRKFYLYSR